MDHIPLLRELAIIAVVGVAVTHLLARLRLPTVAGLLAAGALIGPSGLGLVTALDEVGGLADVGVVLLLFTIGLEFPLARLHATFRQVALGGVLQVGLTVLVAFAGSIAVGLPPKAAVFVGFAVSLSSTAIVLRTLAERRELDAPHGRFVVGTLLFQDLCVVPMVLVIPLLDGVSSTSALVLALGEAILKATVVVVATLALSRLVVPRLLASVGQGPNREVFVLAILGLCIGTAWLTSLAGLSLGLGAFLGGMVVANTEHSHRAMSDVLPMRHAFVSVFFMVLGMLFDPAVLLAHGPLVLALVALFVIGKGPIASLTALLLRFPARSAWLAGVALAQFGEFGFVLTRTAVKHGVVDDSVVEPLLTAGILSMVLTPVAMRIAPRVALVERWFSRLERCRGPHSAEHLAAMPADDVIDHVVIVGFGVAGTLTARALDHVGTRYLALDLATEKVARGRAFGFPVFLDDATSEDALATVRLETARLLILLLNDPQAAVRVLAAARRVAPDVPVLMRTRFLDERASLLELGASDVVAEEVEGGLEVISRMLRRLEVPEPRAAATVWRLYRETGGGTEVPMQ